MSLALLLNPPIKAKFLNQGDSVTSEGILTLDASITEEHTLENEITSHRVEDGSEISDHARRMPDRLAIKGEVTDTPIQYLSFLTTGLGSITGLTGELSPTLNAWAVFEQIMQDRQTVDVVTGFKVYRDMQIERVSAPRSSDIGKRLVFDASLRKIKIVSTDPETYTDDAAQYMIDMGMVVSIQPDPKYVIAALVFLALIVATEAGI